MMRHEESLAHSKYAIHISIKLLLDSIVICYQTLMKQKNPDKSKSFSKTMETSDMYFFNFSQKQDLSQYDPKILNTLAILLDIQSKIKSLNVR
jgi:hypothetical protein